MDSSAAASGSVPARYRVAQSLLGKYAFDRVNKAKVLVVGAGGIGCELLKNLVLTGFDNIEIIDLDTIDLSNLNRQFLFQKQHIKKPKSLVAKQTASSFNPLVNIVAHHANIKEPQFGISYFAKFDLVMNALDNLDARRYVNKMCIAADVPLIESGTTGFLGQVQPIKQGVTECYDCTEKPTPKSFPVCTIRSTPSTPIHCIVWAKSWLFVQLFGADDETEDAELDKAAADGENAQEIDTLRKAAQQMRNIRSKLIKAAAQSDLETVRQMARTVFEKVYNADIQELLSLEAMWTHRPVKPVPLDYDRAINVHDDVSAANGTTIGTESSSKTNGSKSNLKDQRSLSLADNVALFMSSTAALAVRAAADPSEPLSFDKDDEDAMDFVTASSNLRSIVYQIERKTRFEVKQMAGNIIPAIASTNAIIAGMLVLQALQALSGHWDKTRFVSLSRGSNRMLTSWVPAKPNSQCGVCQDLYVPVQVSNLATVTLQQVIDHVLRNGMDLQEEDLCVYDGTRLLADPDFEDNLEKTLAEVGFRSGSVMTVSDEDQQLQVVNLILSVAADTVDDTTPGTVTITTSKALRPQSRAKPVKAELDSDSDNDSDFVALDQSDAKRIGLSSATTSKKRRHDSSDAPTVDDESATTPAKKQRTVAASSPTRTKGGADPTSAIELD